MKAEIQATYARVVAAGAKAGIGREQALVEELVKLRYYTKGRNPPTGQAMKAAVTKLTKAERGADGLAEGLQWVWYLATRIEAEGDAAIEGAALA